MGAFDLSRFLFPDIEAGRSPQHAVEIDQSNPLSQGAYAWLPSSPRLLIGKRPVSASGETGNSSPVGDAGIARKWLRASGAGVDFGVQQIITQNRGVTVLIVAAPTAGANMKVPFSQRIGSGNYTQTDFVFNAATIDSLGAASGNLALTTYHAGSGGLLATGQVDGKRHCWVAGNGPTNGYIFRDGVKQTLATSTRASTFTGATQKLRIGNMADDTTTTYPCDDPVYLVIVWDRLLSEAEAEIACANPWQILKPAGGIDIALQAIFAAAGVSAVASGQAQTDGSAAIAPKIGLAGVGIAVATATAAPATTIPLSAAGFNVTGGTGNDIASVTIDAAGIARAAAQAGLSANILQAAAAAAQSAGNGALAVILAALAAGADQTNGAATIGISSNTAIAAIGGDQSSGNALLTISVKIAAQGGDQIAGNAAGQILGSGQTAAIGQNTTGGAALPTLRVNMAGSGNDTTAGNAMPQLGSADRIAAIGQSITDGQAGFTLTATLTAAGFMRAIAAGALCIEVPISAFGAVATAGSAAIATMPDYNPVPPLRLVGAIERPARLRCGEQRPFTIRHEVSRAHQ